MFSKKTFDFLHLCKLVFQYEGYYYFLLRPQTGYLFNLTPTKLAANLKSSQIYLRQFCVKWLCCITLTDHKLAPDHQTLVPGLPDGDQWPMETGHRNYIMYKVTKFYIILTGYKNMKLPRTLTHVTTLCLTRSELHSNFNYSSQIHWAFKMCTSKPIQFRLS